MRKVSMSFRTNEINKKHFLELKKALKENQGIDLTVDDVFRYGLKEISKYEQQEDIFKTLKESEVREVKTKIYKLKEYLEYLENI